MKKYFKKILVIIGIIILLNFSIDIYKWIKSVYYPSVLVSTGENWTTQTLYIWNWQSDFVENSYKWWMNVCREWKTVIVKNWIKKVILDEKTLDFQACAVDLEYLNKNTIRMSICYSWWWGSWECTYAVMDYFIDSWLWEYQSSWFLNGFTDHWVILTQSKLLKRYFDLKFYSILNIGYYFYWGDESFKKFIHYFKDNWLLKSRKNISFLYW